MRGATAAFDSVSHGGGNRLYDAATLTSGHRTNNDNGNNNNGSGNGNGNEAPLTLDPHAAFAKSEPGAGISPPHLSPHLSPNAYFAERDSPLPFHSAVPLPSTHQQHSSSNAHAASHLAQQRQRSTYQEDALHPDHEVSSDSDGGDDSADGDFFEQSVARARKRPAQSHMYAQLWVVLQAVRLRAPHLDEERRYTQALAGATAVRPPPSPRHPPRALA